MVRSALDKMRKKMMVLRVPVSGSPGEMSERSKQVKSRGLGRAMGSFLGALLLVAGPLMSRAVTAVALDAAGEKPPGQAGGAVQYSPAIADILRLADAKVDAEVIKAYIKNSPIHYAPSATEIIALKDHGVSGEVLIALLQHGGELRAQAGTAGQARGGSAAYPAPTAYAAPPVYGDYGYSYPAYSYGYPYYSSSYCYDYGWPWWSSYWPSFYFSYYPYRSFCHYPYYSCRYPYYSYGHYYPRYGGFQHYGYSHHFSGVHAASFARQSASFPSRTGSFQHVGVSGHAGSFVSHGGGFRGGGGMGGRSFGRGR
jgi:hypothetical protein